MDFSKNKICFYSHKARAEHETKLELTWRQNKLKIIADI